MYPEGFQFQFFVHSFVKIKFPDCDNSSQNTAQITTTYYMRYPIDLNSMLIYNFFFQIFSIKIVTENIIAQSLPNHKHFEASCYSYFIILYY